MSRRTPKLLAVVDKIPYPPRNGVTYPSWNYLVRLARLASVSVLVLAEEPPGVERAEAVRRKVGPVHFVRRVRRNRCVAALRELARVGLRFDYWRYDRDDLERVLHTKFDVVFMTPISVAGAYRLMAAFQPRSTVFVLGLSDSFTHTLRSDGWGATVPGMSWTVKRKGSVARLRSRLVEPLERRLISRFDLILVQSPRDKRFVEATVAPLQEKPEIFVSPNGAKPKLLQLPYTGAKAKCLLSLGGVAGYPVWYCDWFIRNVYLPLRQTDQAITLRIVGKAKSWFERTLRRTPGIDYRGFVPRLGTALAGASILVAPTFKYVGLLNKVLDAMAAGIPTVGIGCYNGLKGFTSGIHGVEVQTADQMISTLSLLLNDPLRLRRISVVARKLATRHDWDRTVHKMWARVEAHIASKSGRAQ